MTDTDLGASLSPDEESYFESGGNTEIPSGEQAATTESDDHAPHDRGEGDKDTGAKAVRMVSLAALHEERNRRKEIDRQYRETQQQLAELKGKFSIVERLNGSQQQSMAPLRTAEDVVGAVDHTRQTVAQLQQRIEQRDAHERAMRVDHDLVNAYRADAAQFEARTPDFKSAYSHLLNSRAQELIAMGYNDPQSLHAALVADEKAIAHAALVAHRSPAEIIYNLARLRGYAAAARPNGAADRLDTIQRGQAANKSLSYTGGSSGEAEITAEALLKMPMDEFEKFAEKNPAKVKRLMGG
jgi:hypothetical protein